VKHRIKLAVSESFAMPSVEQTIKSQYAKVFRQADWRLFKEAAESLLREAAHIKTDDMVFSRRKLLARNSRKRLLIGIATELLLKSVYLKNGYCINKTKEGNHTVGFPLPLDRAVNVELDAADTFSLNKLLDHLGDVVPCNDGELILKGLKIAKAFRNKEGHIVTEAHAFDSVNYRDIEASLVALYRHAFKERLELRFSLEPDERALWNVMKLQE
jgi:hypothetical protein